MVKGYLNRRRSLRKPSGSIGKSLRNVIGHVERLESRAVLSAESAIVLPPPIAPGGAADAPRIVITPIAPTSPTAPITSPVAATGLRLIVPPQARAGVPTLVTAIATDAAGRPVPSFTGSATVTSTDGAASLPLVPVQFRSGRASFSATFATAGAQTVTVTTLTDVPMTATASTTVAAAPAVKSFLVAMPRQVVAGTAVNVSIVAVDAANRPIPGFTGTAALTSSDSAATLPASVSFVNGRATARVTFSTPGSQSITVRGGASGDISATASTDVVGLPVAVGFSLMMPRAAAVGMSVRVTIVAVDAQGRPVPRFSGTATLSSSDTAAKLPSQVTFVGGRAVVRMTFGTLGEQTLTVTSGPSTGGGISGTAKTQVGEVVTQRIRTLPVAQFGS
jgi:hypothetical protein